LKDKIPVPKFLWLHNDKDEIMALYNSVLNGYINYYSFAMNYGKLVSWVHLVLKTSCAKLLAAKLTLRTQRQVYINFGKDLKGDDKIGFIKPKYNLSPWDFKFKKNIDIIQTFYTQSLSSASLNNLECSLCRSTHRVEMHHIRHLKDLNPKINRLDAIMAKKRRKQIAVCRKCHLLYHGSKLQ
jgi:hypothetical protein